MIGSEIRGDRTSYGVRGLLGTGGQGLTYTVVDRGSGEVRVAKVYHESQQRSQQAGGSQALSGENLTRDHRSSALPTIRSATVARSLGHISPYVDGRSLESYLAEPSLCFASAIQIAVAIAHSIAVLHRECDLIHGDLHSENVLVRPCDTVYRIFLIDFDNFVSADEPTAPCLGQLNYMAPEVRTRKSTPNRQSELFSLAILFHELLLRKHSTQGYASSQPAFERAMQSGWLHDPMHRAARETRGYPSGVLSADLCRLFRRALSRDPGNRPEAIEWKDALLVALQSIFVCPNCSLPDLVDHHKRVCPNCRASYPVLTLRGPFGKLLLRAAMTRSGERSSVRNE